MRSWKLLLPPGNDVPRQIIYAGFTERANLFTTKKVPGSDLSCDSLMKTHTHLISAEWEITGSTSFENYGGGNSNFLARLVRENTSGPTAQVASMLSGDNVASTILLAGATENLKLSTEITYGYKCNAFFDVFVPAMIWKSLELPTLQRDGILKPPGVTLTELTKTFAEGVMGAFDELITGVEGEENLSNMSRIGSSLVWGPLTLHGMVLTKASPTFKMSVDENGYPTQAVVKIEFTSSTAAVTQHIKEFLKQGVLIFNKGKTNVDDEVGTNNV